MIRRLALTLAALVLVAQLGPDGIPVRCWFLDGVALKDVPAVGPFWLNTDRSMDGFLDWTPVRGNDRDAAARRMGFHNAAECTR